MRKAFLLPLKRSVRLFGEGVFHGLRLMIFFPIQRLPAAVTVGLEIHFQRGAATGANGVTVQVPTLYVFTNSHFYSVFQLFFHCSLVQNYSLFVFLTIFYNKKYGGTRKCTSQFITYF